MKPLDLMDVLDDLPEELIAQELAPPKANRIVKLYRFSAAAACLMLTLGLVQFAWDRPQKIPTAPPVAETTTSTETTVLMESTPSAVTTDSLTETQEIPTSQTSPSLPETTAVVPVIPQESSIRMITPVIPAETLAKTSTQQTTAPTTTVLTKTEPVSTDPTDPTEVYPVTDQESESITTTDDENVSESLDPTETDVTPEPTVPVSEPPKLPGFVWELLSNAEYPVWGIRVQPDAAEADCPTNFSIDYQTDRKRYRIRGVQTDWKYRVYDVSDTETGISFEIRQFIRRDFEFRWDNDGSQQISTLGDLGNGIHGFFMYDPMHQQFAMCWDDGNYVMTVQSQEPDILDDALPLAFHAVKI